MISVVKKYFNNYATKLLFFSVFFSILLQNVSAQELIAEIIPSKTFYGIDDTVRLALKIKIPSKYHLYANPLGPGIGKPLQISVNGADNIIWHQVKKPLATKFKPSIGDWVWAYENQQVFFFSGDIKENFEGDINGTIHIDGLICNTDCIPVKKDVQFSVKVTKSSSGQLHYQSNPEIKELMKSTVDSMPLLVSEVYLNKSSITGIDLSGLTVKPPVTNTSVEWNYSPVEKKIDFNISLAILFGFLAGIIMNFMPCVLPVLGIKIISFSETRSSSSRKRALIKSLIFSSGMLSVFLILASFAAFANFSWGQQFQNPKVLVIIICTIVVFALGMFDVFMIMIPSSISSMGKKRNSGLTGDFFNGMFATILATPCSGPLLGATLAWTLTQKPLVIYAIFTSIGLGMAFPYILLSSSSTLSRMIPKPGVWMNDFKHFMGFVLLAFAVYLMIGLPGDMVISTIGLCLVFAFCITFYTRFAPFGSSVKRKFVFTIITLAMASSGLYFNFGVFHKMISSEKISSSDNISDTGEWKEFSVELIKDAHENRQNIIIDFTANWCVNCQFNKVTVLHSTRVSELIKKKNIVAIKADLTRPDPQIESLLHHLGSRSVPFLAVFPGNKPYEPIIMRDILNKKSLVDVLEKLENDR